MATGGTSPARVSGLRLPWPKPRPPAGDVATILLVGRAEFSAQRRFLIKDDEEMNPKRDCGHRGYHARVRMPEHDPKENPSYGETDVHRIANVSIETHDDEP